jgi:excisionase family DNA binding protein
MSRPKPRTSNEPHYLNPAEAAHRFGCSPRTIRRYIAAGQLVGYRFGPRMVRVREDDVAALLRQIPTVGGAA